MSLIYKLTNDIQFSSKKSSREPSKKNNESLCIECIDKGCDDCDGIGFYNVSNRNSITNTPTIVYRKIPHYSPRCSQKNNDLNTYNNDPSIIT